MKKRLLLFYILLSFTLPACDEPADNCPENIYSQPEYGHVEKCPKQIEADEKFIENSEKKYTSISEAARFYAQEGWSFMRKNDTGSAMKRFNQAWLMDKTFPGSYWGFGAILGLRNDIEGSKQYFDKALALNSTDHGLYLDAATTYFKYAFAKKSKTHLKQGVDLLRKAKSLEQKNNRINVELARGFYFLAQKDSALHYMKLSLAADPSSIPLEFQQRITSMK